MKYFEAVKWELQKFEPLGLDRAENGTLLIGRAPHIAQYAWLHSLYRTLNQQDIVALESEIQAEIPADYKQFLMNCSNGLDIFVGEFYLYGLRKESGRSIEASRQPFSPVIANVDERPGNAKRNFFFVGGYSWDGSSLYIDKETNRVHYCGRWDAKSLYQWASFEEMIVSEVKRIGQLFDEKGVIIDKDLFTTPVEIK